jgi:dTDP-4-dehydrorhamnose 3,5-epimerase
MLGSAHGHGSVDRSVYADRYGSPVQIRELAVRDAHVLDLVPHGDARGRFTEWYRADVLSGAVGHGLPLAQANHSVSARGVLRGVHFALVPPGQAKYVYCPAGRVLDVVVDVRVGSPTFGAHDAVVLDSEQPRAVYLAEGLGHAFVSLADGSSVTYLVSSGYDPDREFGIDPLDPALDLPWPADVEFELSAKDRQAPTLAEARDQGLLPTMDECTARYAQLGAGG